MAFAFPQLPRTPFMSCMHDMNMHTSRTPDARHHLLREEEKNAQEPRLPSSLQKPKLPATFLHRQAATPWDAAQAACAYLHYKLDSANTQTLQAPQQKTS